MSVSKLAREIHALANNGPDKVPEEECKQLLEACDSLRGSFQGPAEAAYEAMFSVCLISYYYPLHG